LENEKIQKINNFGQSLFEDPLTLKKAVLLCFFLIGLRFSAEFIAYHLKFYFGLIPNIVFLAAALFIIRKKYFSAE